VLSYLLQVVIYIFLPGVLIFIQTRKPEELMRKDFQEKWGMLYLNLSVESKSKLFYSFAFLLRRLIFVFIGFTLSGRGGL
jgi:hypothetical protein